jgi:DNA-binding transcriptional MocR family regulator
MIAALQKHFPATVQWTTPQGGLFLWVTLPEPMDAAAILQAATAENVAFVPGSSFFADGSGGNTLRLNFSNANPSRINEGIERLGIVLGRALEARATGTEPYRDEVSPRGKCFPYG